MLEAREVRKLPSSGEPLRALWKRQRFSLEEGLGVEREAGGRDPGRATRGTEARARLGGRGEPAYILSFLSSLPG